MPPTLSIITPAFNGKRFVEFCIENVIEQGCDDLEHLIIDGGSLDGSAEIIESYARRYGHIRWVSEKDGGQADAMNKGIEMAAGRVLGFLNVDDYYEPGALKEVLGLVSPLPEPTLLVGNCNVWDDAGRLSFVSRPANIGLKNLLLGRYLDAFPMNPSAYFYHKSLHSIVPPYDLEDQYAHDVRFIFEAVQHANVVYVDRTWGNYRYLEGTKTYEDEKAGGNQLRVKRITEHYRRCQSIPYRLYLSAVAAFLKARARLS